MHGARVHVRRALSCRRNASELFSGDRRCGPYRRVPVIWHGAAMVKAEMDDWD